MDVDELAGRCGCRPEENLALEVLRDWHASYGQSGGGQIDEAHQVLSDRARGHAPGPPDDEGHADAGVAERSPAELGDLLLPDVEDAEDLARRIDGCLSNPATISDAMVGFSARLRARSWDDMANDIVTTVCLQ